MRPILRFTRIVAVVALVALLPGCTMVRIAYNNAEPLVRYTAHDYFDLDEAQIEQFRKRLLQFHDWHRTTELPVYAELLRMAVKKAANGVSREEVRWAAEALRSRYHLLVARAIDDAAPILVTLSLPQIAELEKRLAKANAKHASEFLPKDQRKRHRAQLKRMLERFREWTGTLTDAQETRIERFVQAHARTTAMRFDNRLRWQREAVALIRRERSPEALAPRLADIFTRPAAHRTPEFAAAFERWEAHFIDLVLEFEPTLSAEQRAHVLRRMERYAEDFEALSAQGGTAGAAVGGS